uniref:Uncharacterized protein WRKY transcription factor 46 n=1 Tax=Rhizophora mucronata TaxID=61149 RepID=A0A2P2LN19_RHIMU
MGFCPYFLQDQKSEGGPSLFSFSPFSPIFTLTTVFSTTFLLLGCDLGSETLESNLRAGESSTATFSIVPISYYLKPRTYMRRTEIQRKRKAGTILNWSVITAG